MRTVTFLMLALLSFGCSTTHVLDSWKAENASPLKRSTKRAVVVVANNKERRERAEAAFAEDINAVVARNLFTPEEWQDKDLVKARLLEQGFEEVVVMRVVGVEEEQTRLRGPMWSNWMGLNTPYVPKTRVDLVTSIYDITEGRLVYQLSSHTYEPTSVEDTMAEQVKAGLKRLRDDGMLVD
ncbi:MAG: hypothetical protein DI536_08740 [Archangium gephyra]|uniref:Lipoprotein n=1 Tax=Archangium gephyra TaxID=48 RepID=A0A2W5TSN6_9BACT|nr:MAG: hypothetical protein DI536_08740 [Archangium gephyra]